MRPCTAYGLLPLVGLATLLPAQTIARSVTASDGTVQVIYPSRPNACGDGESYIGNVFGRNQYFSGSVVWSGRTDRRDRACVHGPARVVATVIHGEVTRLRVFVGPVPPPSVDTRTLTVSASEAAGWLGDLASHGASRVASAAILPLILADSADPWPLLLRIARDADRPREVRSSALTWLSNGVNEHLGIADADEHASDDDEMRSQAVFVLSQRPKSESVPELIDLARTGKHPAARKAAIFWLGQSGDPRVVDVYAELLGVR